MAEGIGEKFYGIVKRERQIGVWSDEVKATCLL
jgi:hypothetical protein